MTWSLRLGILVSVLQRLCGGVGLCVAIAAQAAAPADGRESGSALLRNFTAAEYGGSVQNWAIVQDRRGVIYVGNGEGGVLEYDGVSWRKIPTPNRTVVRSLALGRDGRVYVGAIGEIGYLAPDSSGALHYVSLLDRLAAPDRDFADVWRVFAAAEGVYFSTSKRLIRIGARRVRVWNASTSFHLAFLVRGRIYLREVGRGLLQLVDDELRLAPQGEQFADEKVYTMLAWPDEADPRSRALLIGTRTKGWFVLDGDRLRRWRTQADEELARAQLYGAIRLADGTLAAATLHGGVLLLDKQGRLTGRIDKSSGLINQTAFDLFQDRQGGLWLALDNGIARADVAAPLTRFDALNGLAGSVIALHRHAGRLYAGTTQGLYRLESGPRRPARFARVAGITDQIWAFLSRGESLLVGGTQGVYEIRGGVARLIRASPVGAFSLLQSRLDPERVFVGLQEGIASMREQGGRWVDEGVVRGVSDEVRTMYEQDDGRVWLGTLSTGVVALPLEPQGRLDPDAARGARRYGVDQGLPRSPDYVWTLDGEALFATPQGVFRFDAARERFEADARFAPLFQGRARQVFPIVEDNLGRVWMFRQDEAGSHREAGVAVLHGGSYHWDSRPLRELSGGSIGAILAEPSSVVWFGGDDGVYRYDAHRGTEYARPYTALVRRVSGRDGRLVFDGAGSGPTPEIEFERNALRFEFAAPSFGARRDRFQVKLEGADRQWSAWSEEAYRDYTNLHEGSYRLRVRAMNDFGAVSGEGVYDLRILPPWYRTPLAWLAYVALAVAALAAVARWRSAALRARTQRLARLVATRTEELSEANRALQAANRSLAELALTDALTGLRNRRYLMERIGEDVATVRREHERNALWTAGAAPGAVAQLAFVMVDIDHFKQINDHHGHAAGDRILEQFGAILREVCRDTDTAVRWGGEEFLVVARQASVHTGIALAERIRSQVEAHDFTLDEGKTLRRTCSVGFAVFPICPGAAQRCGWELSVELADWCLYEAKRSGRNAWVGVQAAAQAPGAEFFDDPAAAFAAGHLELIRMAAHSACEMVSV